MASGYQGAHAVSARRADRPLRLPERTQLFIKMARRIAKLGIEYHFKLFLSLWLDRRLNTTLLYSMEANLAISESSRVLSATSTKCIPKYFRSILTTQRCRL